MTRLRGSSRAIGWVLISLGTVSTFVLLMHWAQCFGGMNDGCYGATQSDFSWIAMSVLWIIAFPLSIVGAYYSSPKQPLMLVGVALLMLINPLTDRGLFFVSWDVADTLPFTGTTIAVATIVAGVLHLVSSQRLTPTVTRTSLNENPR